MWSNAARSDIYEQAVSGDPSLLDRFPRAFFVPGTVVAANYTD
jgi:hypothetical protein